MGLATIQSTNPQLSFILRKNPQTGMLVKIVRKGRIFGWYSNPQAYHLYFKDSDSEVSYGHGEGQETEFEYNSMTRYNAAMFVLNAISDFLGSAIKQSIPEDERGYENSFTSHFINIHNLKYVEIFNQYFPQFQIQTEEKAKRNYTLTIRTQEPVQNLLHFVNLFVLFNVIKNKEYYDCNPQVIQKFLTSLNHIDAPYFIRYVFKVNLLRGPKLFEQFLPLLKSGQCSEVEFEIGDNHYQRRQKISKIVKLQHSLLDIGCGEGRYFQQFAKKFEGEDATGRYIGIDPNEEKLEEIRHLSRRKMLKEPLLFNALDNYLLEMEEGRLPDQVEVLLTEVIEHMEIGEARKFVSRIIERVPWSQIVITSPNKDFNRFYQFDEDETRDEDHKFELTQREFQEFMHSLNLTGTQLEYFEIGDRIEGIQPTLGVVLTRSQQ